MPAPILGSAHRLGVRIDKSVRDRQVEGLFRGDLLGGWLAIVLRRVLYKIHCYGPLNASLDRYPQGV